jgi:hypothetical protein
MAGYQNHWDRCRLGQIRYHLVPMIRTQSLKACCHFAIQTAIRIGSRTANPIRIPIGYLIRFGSRFEIHCHLSRCPMFQNRMNHWIQLSHWMTSYPRSQSCPMIPIRWNCLRNRTNHSNPRS